jgi:carnosine N-methyltransferase
MTWTSHLKRSIPCLIQKNAGYCIARSIRLGRFFGKLYATSSKAFLNPANYLLHHGIYLTPNINRQYRQTAHYNVTHLRRQAFYSLPSAHVDLLSEPPFSLPQTLRDVDDAIDSNADIAEAILQSGLAMYGIDHDDCSWQGTATPRDLDKARSTIRQLYRDWSKEGHREIDTVLSNMQRLLQEHLPELPTSQLHKHRVLVPGAGLGRTVFDLIAAGYSVEGNEISYHQIIACNYMLNGTEKAGQHVLYPFALGFSNHINRANQLRAFEIPDIHLEGHLEEKQKIIQSELPFGERMSMSAGDFCVLYREPSYKESFAAVATCFFIDTAPNVINYIETIKRCLAPGGIWVNGGPLLWHFESTPTPAEKEKQEGRLVTDGADENRGIGDPGSFELSNDEVVALVQHCGFEIVKHEERVDAAAGYIMDDRSMLTHQYHPSFWVAKKL